ncbi:hypothetical protein JW979_04160 [bacterium]|nr:hypothetical protein [candidate division CSSED10-310 bacterium]
MAGLINSKFAYFLLILIVAYSSVSTVYASESKVTDTFADIHNVSLNYLPTIAVVEMLPPSGSADPPPTLSVIATDKKGQIIWIRCLKECQTSRQLNNNSALPLVRIDRVHHHH